MVSTVINGAKSLLPQTGALFGDAMNIYGAASDYKMARQKGSSRAGSIAKAAGTFVIGEMLGAWAAPVFLAPVLAQGISGKLQHNAEVMSGGYAQAGKFGSGSFNMTEAGYTMRQRSLNAIRQNGSNAGSVLGNEARTYYHGCGY